MKKTIQIVAIAVMAHACGEGINPAAPTSASTCSITQNGNGNVGGCGDVTVTQPSAPPSTTPPTAQDCRVDYLRGSGPDFLGSGQEATFDITPMQTFNDKDGATQQREVSAACNEARPQPEWSSGDVRILSVAAISTGFSAKVKRTGSGLGRVSVKFEDRQKDFSVQ